MRVEYNFDLLQNCQCGACPVHDASACVMEKTGGMKFTTCSSTPPPDDVEGIYCSFQKGKSSCTGFDVSKACLCPTCSVWRSHSLDTSYYCVKGSAG